MKRHQTRKARLLHEAASLARQIQDYRLEHWFFWTDEYQNMQERRQELLREAEHEREQRNH